MIGAGCREGHVGWDQPFLPFAANQLEEPQGGRRLFSLRALAAQNLLQLLGLGCREAAGIAAIRSPRSEVFQGN